ncbi:MAG: antibiotic biosynthesis monooxygenase [Anaerolineae bacterium]|nr:antibiotic biosynthesis monooxygenase [Anaerolineae bacterium]
MYGLMGKIQAQLGQREALVGYLLQAAEVLREAEGCYLYLISGVSADEQSVWVTEVWRSQEDHRASLTLPAVQEVIAVARPLIAGMGERFEFQPIGGKGLPADKAE